jgi:hypothetical protein
MMRFVTARAAFEEFPTLAKAVRLEPTDDDPRDFVRAAMAAGKLRDAAAVCAYLLAKRDAVWWVCRSLRSRPGLIEPASQALLAAEAWAREPTEEARDIAEKWAKASDQQAPATWVAYAAGFTSGNLAVLPDGPVRTPGHLTGDCARVALVFAECRLEAEPARAFLREVVEAALRWLTSGDGEPPS